MFQTRSSQPAAHQSFSLRRGSFAGAWDAPAGYELTGPCGNGSFSEICKVRCRESERFFALKRLRPEWLNEPDARKLFSAEADAGRQARGEHVVRLAHSDTTGERPFLIFEWLDGQTLQQRLESSEPLTVPTAIWIARQTAEGLHTLQRAGFVHGDVKPENIFLCRNGLVKLIDLGFAHRIDREPVCAEQKVLVGTAEYLAPEVLTGDVADPVAKDVYSLGVTLFRLLAGRMPFLGEHAAEIMRLQRQAKPPELKSLCPEAPEELVDLVNAMLAKQPLRRPAHLAGLVTRLVELEIATLPEVLAAG